jgi:hypothetical protein
MVLARSCLRVADVAPLLGKMAPSVIAAIDQTPRAYGRVPSYALIANEQSIINESVPGIATRLAHFAAE